jgi:hypothetical protein
MGLFDFLKNKRKIANINQFPEIVEKLLVLLNKAQETAIGTIWRGLETMNINWKFDPLKTNPFVIDALYGYQITCLVGFSSQEKLIKSPDILKFRKELLKQIESTTEQSTKIIKEYNQRYLDCWGDIPCLNKKFSEDMIELYKVPDNKNEVHEVREMLEDTSVVLALQTQVDTAFVFGNKSLEKQLIKRFKKYLYEESWTSKLKKK